MDERTLLQNLIKCAEQFRNTPIVDDDFCLYRDRFDTLVGNIKSWLVANPPLVIQQKRMIQDGCMGEQECVVHIVTNPRK